MPFRDSHECVARAVKAAEVRALTCRICRSPRLQAFSPVIADDVLRRSRWKARSPARKHRRHGAGERVLAESALAKHGWPSVGRDAATNLLTVAIPRSRRAGLQGWNIDESENHRPIAGTLTTASFVPQVWKIWKPVGARPVVGHGGSVFCVGVSLWLFYGIPIRRRPSSSPMPSPFVLSLAIAS